jgi:hypothetical protein
MMGGGGGGMMMGGFGPGGGPPNGRRRFQEQYHCYSVAYADKAHLEVRTYQIRMIMVSSL